MEIMSRCRYAVLMVVALAALMLAGYLAGDAAPPKREQKMNAEFKALQKRLPALVSDWAKRYEGFDRPDEVDVEVKLARFIGPSEAKVSIWAILKEKVLKDRDPCVINLPITFYLRFYEGHWTTTGGHWPADIDYAIPSLMLSIDQAGER